MGDLIAIAIQILLLPFALAIGGLAERRHFRRLDSDEARLRHVKVSNLKRIASPRTVEHSELVIGHVVIATDYWKSFVTRLRNIVGGELKSAETLMLRARREALVRLTEEAARRGAHEVWNVRFEFSNVGMMRGNNGAIQVEILAYGTAVYRKAQPAPANDEPSRCGAALMPMLM